MNTYMTEGVGKRIVDALKKQSETELVNQTLTQPRVETAENFVQNDFTELNAIAPEPAFVPETNYNPAPQPMFNTVNPQPQNIYAQVNNNFQTDLNDLEVPANVAILRQLISQLPSGVSRQAGALVIKQTMEALGISMKSVLQEAQQLQENINISARDCQNSILECKKQINTLEAQVQKYQKQSASLNDIVSLFLQIN
ncbi:MAG: hypothetical protein NC390_06885 [Fusobacterium sp.]|nr:hypothetical protein [Fusobacterium sp.]